MADQSVVIQRHIQRYRFFYYVPKYGKLYKFMRVVIALGACGYALVLVKPAIDQGTFLWYVVGIAAIAGAALAWTVLIHGLNALLEKILWRPAVIAARLGERFTYDDDGARLHDFSLKEITNIRFKPEVEEVAQQGGMSIRKLLQCKDVKILYTQNGRQKTCDFTDFPDEEVAKLVKELERRGVDFAADRAYKESRWVFGKAQEGKRYDVYCEIYANGDMRFVATENNNYFLPFQDGKPMTTVNLHDFEEFYDVSNQSKAGNWSLKLLAVDKDGQEHSFYWGSGGDFAKWLERIGQVTGKGVEDRSVWGYEPSARSYDDELDYGPSSEEIRRQRRELDSQMAATMLSASLEMDRLEALGMDKEVTAKLVGMEAGFAIGEVYNLREQKKNL